jgi:hypothetical protein
VHIVIDERNSEMVNFAFSKGSEHDIHFLEKLFKTALGAGSATVVMCRRRELKT